MTSPLNITELLQLATKAAEQTISYLQTVDRDKLQVELKQNQGSRAAQVVTEVDRHCEALIYRVLEPSFEKFDLAWLAEESAEATLQHGRFHKQAFWCVDPLDGTLPFVSGLAGYAVSIALVSNKGEPLIGVVGDPEQGAVVTTAHKMKGLSDQNNAFTLFADASFLEDGRFPVVEQFFAQLASEMELTKLTLVPHQGAVMNALGVLKQPNACYLKLPKKTQGGGCLWDFAATAALLALNEKPVTDAQGHRLNLNQPSLFFNRSGVVISSSERIHKAVLAFARRYTLADA